MFIPSVISLLTIIEKFEYEQIDWKKFVYLNLYKLYKIDPWPLYSLSFPETRCIFSVEKSYSQPIVLFFIEVYC